MKKTFQLGLLFLGALVLSLTLVTAKGKCTEAKCGDTKKDAKETPKKGKCGQGKCS